MIAVLPVAASLAQNIAPAALGVSAAAHAAGPTAAPPTNSMLAQLHAERVARRAASTAASSTAAAGPSNSAAAGANARGATPPGATILSYNVWFREDVALQARVKGISDQIMAASPDVICLQEMTPLIHVLLSQEPWWPRYSALPGPAEVEAAGSYFTMLLWRRDRADMDVGGNASIPFGNSRMGRDLKAVNLRIGGLSLRVATSHLESPTGRNQLYSEPRVAQFMEATAVLDKSAQDVVFIGDMNWNEENDGPPRLPSGWCDAWTVLHPGDPGYTYDAQSNAMLRKYKNPLRLRLDRAFCKLQRWDLEDLRIVGRQAIGAARFEGRPVLPSDHFGLVLKLKGKA